MKRWLTVKVLITTLLLGAFSAHAQEDEINLRFITNEDGSRTEFHKMGDPRTLIKKTRSKDGVLQSVTVYTLNAGGDQVSAQIYDAKETLLYNVIYGYDKKTGQMVEEQIWDARVERISKDTGQKIPVRRFIYNYDAQGRQQRPVALTLIPGAVVEGSFIDNGSAIPKGIFDE